MNFDVLNCKFVMFEGTVNGVTYTEWGAPIIKQNHQPRHRFEREISDEMKKYSSYNYLPEFCPGKKYYGELWGNEDKYRVDGAILELRKLVCLKSQRVQGTTDDKLAYEIMTLHKICEMGHWVQALIVIDDPNKKMKCAQAHLDRNSSAYRDLSKYFPTVKFMTAYEFKKEHYNLLDGEKFISIFGMG